MVAQSAALGPRFYAGCLEGGLCNGFEKLVMDADRLGSDQKILD